MNAEPLKVLWIPDAFIAWELIGFPWNPPEDWPFSALTVTVFRHLGFTAFHTTITLHALARTGPLYRRAVTFSGPPPDTEAERLTLLKALNDAEAFVVDSDEGDEILVEDRRGIIHVEFREPPEKVWPGSASSTFWGRGRKPPPEPASSPAVLAELKRQTALLEESARARRLDDLIAVQRSLAEEGRRREQEGRIGGQFAS